MSYLIQDGRVVQNIDDLVHFTFVKAIKAKSEIELSSFNALILIYLFSNKFRFSALHNFIILHIILKQM